MSEITTQAEREAHPSPWPDEVVERASEEIAGAGTLTRLSFDRLIQSHVRLERAIGRWRWFAMAGWGAALAAWGLVAAAFYVGS